MILVVDMNEKEKGLGYYEYVLPITSLITSDFEVVHYKKVSSFHLKKCEKVILSGTPLKDSRYLADTEYFDWLVDFEKPVLGICAGMQKIAQVFGCEIVENQEIGMVEVKSVQENVLFKGSFKVYALHNLSIIPNENFITLAKSDKCVHSIKHNKREIYGVLFHPEARTRKVIQNYTNNLLTNE